MSSCIDFLAAPQYLGEYTLLYSHIPTYGLTSGLDGAMIGSAFPVAISSVLVILVAVIRGAKAQRK
ncbi:hypothetical protein HYPSUDRAFT_42226 [Hypholoma sublateritium FD-334 SS-4]|uniref:Uncharacterized protein n=1 Tax=Hypholoma sublateritium (strain FD-334 SS-4) TaxID=945553 RepID=A0A0D2MCX2_HYPSF|nr:hypothetical protein HYPSUDRAFT_42226 [Hypholoma sublateritium FD-334 SS-4]